MSNKTWYAGKIINSDTHDVHEGSDGCKGCAFDDKAAGGDCYDHACFWYDFPEGHAMSNTTDIIWIEKAAA